MQHCALELKAFLYQQINSIKYIVGDSYFVKVIKISKKNDLIEKITMYLV